MTSSGRSQVNLAELSEKDLALLTYFCQPEHPKTCDLNQFLTRYPFSRYLFGAAEIGKSLDALVLDGFLRVEVEDERKLYSQGKRLRQKDVIEAGNVMPFMHSCAVAVMKETPLLAFAELTKAAHDPCLVAFRHDRRVASNPEWWESVTKIAALITDVVSSRQPVSKFVHVLADLIGVESVGQLTPTVEQRIDAEWTEQSLVSIPFFVDKVTPWQSLHCHVFIVRAAGFSADQRDTLTRLTWDSITTDAAVAHIVIPIGEMGKAEEDALKSVKGALLDSQDLKAILLAKKPREKLREILRSRLDIVLLSPYTTRGSVSDEMFFGRSEEVGIILSHREQNFAVYGSRRSGKTSLLKRLKQIWTNKRPVVLLDCELAIDSESRFCAATSREFGLPEVDTFEDLTRAAAEAPGEAVLLVDEIDEVFKNCEPRRLLAALRKMHEERGIQCVVAGWTSLHKLARDMSSPMFNLAHPIYLGPLTELPAIALAQEPMLNLGVMFEEGDSTVKHLIYLTGRFPYLIQSMCDGIVKQLSATKSRMITRGLIGEVFETRIAREVCDLFYDGLNREQKIIVSAALLVREMSLPGIVERVQKYCPHLTLDKIRAELDALVILFLLRNTSVGGYEWVHDQFPKILRRNIDPEFVIEQMGKEHTQEQDFPSMP